MEPQTILLIVMGLACPIGMGLMMWLMNKNMSQQSEHLSPARGKGSSAASQLAELREQRQTLEAEIAELNQIVELEARHEALLTNPSPAADDIPVSAVS